MASYGAKKQKATAKRKRRPKKVEPAKKRLTPKRASVVKRPKARGKRSLPKKVRTKRTRISHSAKRATAAKKRIRKKIAVRARPRKKVAIRARPQPRAKVATRSRPRKKVAARARPRKKLAVRARPKKKVVRRARAKTKEQLQREHANITRQLEKIVADEQKARETGKRSPERKKVRERKKEVEERRRKRVLEPKKISTKKNFERLKKTFHQKLKQAAQPSKKYPYGQLPRLTKISRRINSDRNIGEQRRVRIKRVLKPENVEDVLYKVRHAVQSILRTRREEYPQWLAKIAFSGQGDRLLGSGGKLIDVSEKPDATPDDQLFQTQGFDSTGTRGSEVGMLETLETLLDMYAAMNNTTVYLHYVLVMNFKFRRLK